MHVICVIYSVILPAYIIIAIKSFQIIKYNYTKNHCNHAAIPFIHQISIILKQGEEPLNLMGMSPPIVIQPQTLYLYTV